MTHLHDIPANSSQPDPHDHSHTSAHPHHHHEHGLWGRIAAVLHLPGYSHSHERPAASDALYANELGIRTVKLAFAALGLTTLIQIAIYLMSGSVALLADTAHNLVDALNSLPLWIAFVLVRRAANKRYTYGFGRAEDLAGLVIVLSIITSAGYILWESFQRFMNPQPLERLGWIAAASLVGFAGNELVAMMQIRVGHQIGSEAMVADGQHARIDGLTSLAVLIAAAGSWIGLPLLDPIIGLIIGVAIVFIARDASIAMWNRLMDAVDPVLVERVEQVLESHHQILKVIRLRMRWIGHRLHVNAVIALEDDLPLRECESITDHVRHHLLHDIPHLDEVIIAAVPWSQHREAACRQENHHHHPKHA